MAKTRFVPEARWMERAFKIAHQGIRQRAGGPFGAVIVQGGKCVAQAHNTVLRDVTPTAHAEVNAIALAAQKLKAIDLSGAVIYTTTEPCPMCFSAIHWARLDRVVYGTRIQDVQARGFNELAVPARSLKRLAGSRVAVSGPFMRSEGKKLLQAWDNIEDLLPY